MCTLLELIRVDIVFTVGFNCFYRAPIDGLPVLVVWRGRETGGGILDAPSFFVENLLLFVAGGLASKCVERSAASGG